MVFGNCGVLSSSSMIDGKGYVEMTSIDAETSQDIATSIIQKGGRYLEAQVWFAIFRLFSSNDVKHKIWTMSSCALMRDSKSVQINAEQNWICFTNLMYAHGHNSWWIRQGNLFPSAIFQNLTYTRLSSMFAFFLWSNDNLSYSYYCYIQFKLCSKM